MLGGRNFYSFSHSREQWTKLPNLPSRRWYHGIVVIGNSVYIVGGLHTIIARNNTIDQYNISTKTFEKVATMKESRYSFGICAFNKSEVLIAGGCDDKDEITNNCFLFNTNSKTFKYSKYEH